MPEAAGDVLAVDDDERRLVAARAARVADRAACGGPRPPTTSPTNRMVAGTSRTAHTLTQERHGARRPTSRRRRGSCRRSRLRAPRPARRARWVQLVALPLGCRAAWSLPSAPRVGRQLFVFAGVIALILNPVVSFAAPRPDLPRGVAIAVVYLGFIGRSRLRGLPARQPVSDQVATLRPRRPSLVDDANQRLADVQDYFDRKGINVEIKKQGQTALETLQREGRRRHRHDRLVRRRDLLETVVTAGLGADPGLRAHDLHADLRGADRRRSCAAIMPPGDGSREDDYPTRVQRAVGGYVRGQLLFSLAMGTGAGARPVDLRRARDLPRRPDLRASPSASSSG